MAFSRETPEWPEWAYHVTSLELVDEIAAKGLKAEPNAKANDEPVIFVEPDLDGVLPYHHPGRTAVLRFRTPGFAELDNGETVLFGKSEYSDGYPDLPLVGDRGGVGRVPPERLQILHKGKWRWLLPEAKR